VNTILKQRLIGALILVALGVVFWPIIFVEPGDQAGQASAPMPAPPRVDTTPIPAPDTSGINITERASAQREADAEAAATLAAVEEDASAGSETDTEAVDESTSMAAVDEPETAVEEEVVAAVPLPEPQRPRTEAPAKPEIDAEGVPVAWILQVASVSTREKANALRDTLLAADHKAYVKQIRSGDRTLYRVYIGPKFEKAQLERIKPSVDSTHGVTSLIVRYVP
jgi:DedD protein